MIQGNQWMGLDYRQWERGAEVCTGYATIREQLLVKPLRSSGGPSEPVLSDVGEVLRAVSGYYNQAARSAATV